MLKLICGLAVLPFLTGIAMAAAPTPLSDAQMDAVTAGAETSGGLSLLLASPTPLSSGAFLFRFSETDITNTGTVMVNVDPVACPACYLNISNGDMSLQAQFGPATPP